MLRFLQELLRQALDIRRHRRREEHRVAYFGDQLQDRLDVFHEAHIQHLIGLIEDNGLDII
ncbi:hypothetical protein PA598K_01124 [Paenibacillus sp. 598K]|nr:hypothetical protein PA598K_01124 [Paenibacillus sp. 598K]